MVPVAMETLQRAGCQGAFTCSTTVGAQLVSSDDSGLQLSACYLCSQGPLQGLTSTAVELQ